MIASVSLNFRVGSTFSPTAALLSSNCETSSKLDINTYFDESYGGGREPWVNTVFIICTNDPETSRHLPQFTLVLRCLLNPALKTLGFGSIVYWTLVRLMEV